MPTQPHQPSEHTPTQPTQPRLSLLDRFLPMWILAAMALGLALSQFTPGLGRALESMQLGGISLPIALSLLVMMYPPLAKVRYDKAGGVAANKKLMTLSLALNWIVGPALMFALAWAFLPDQPELRTGLIIVGLARCIAMVLVWSDLSCADREVTAVLVAINAIFQVLMFAALGWFYLQILPGWLGLPTTSAEFSFWAIFLSVVVFLGVPLAAGAGSRIVGEKARGRQWYEDRFLPKISPLALVGLLYTIVLLFALQGDEVIAAPGSVARVAVPMTLYFFIMFAIALLASRGAGLGYARSASVAFTAAGNNFELAIAVAIGTFGADSGQALAGTIGPLVEVPVLVALVYALQVVGPKLFPQDATLPQAASSR
ncbi:MAG TPA: ACR3 family arsenite efflux transporter [Candidatus Corynebacterium gallistercoris]|uniref:ACR3 family arsenite efflux transporter n=1 Tax=Candidatus Corynebacterium gallistercoris TaxID=2838530 RepID=A0A9D1URI2_9CORY|nr:ACR3 family arsenite efflux transporter [Candidatus Corynebacterium gallistercoris]